ncbi:MAG: DEAD/DEAH box helicase protein, partial [uncultured bacterium]
MGGSSGLGKFIKLYVRLGDLPVDLKGDSYGDFILKLMKKLEEADYIKSQKARSEKNEEIPIYRLKIEKLIWKLGDEATVKADLIKRRSYRDQAPRPNAFFKKMYQRDFSRMKRFRAEDHTGQLNTEARLDREDRFRADWYCDEARKQIDEKRIWAES